MTDLTGGHTGILCIAFDKTKVLASCGEGLSDVVCIFYHGPIVAISDGYHRHLGFRPRETYLFVVTSIVVCMYDEAIVKR